MIEKVKKEILELQNQLQNHPIYKNINTIESLHLFMSHHVYSVWDFMSLVKFLQNEFAPSSTPWKPLPNKKIIHFINDIVLEEESDVTPDGQHMSHFEMYCLAMKEVGLNSDSAFSFANSISLDKFQETMLRYKLPQEIQDGLNQTFSFLDPSKPHIAAAAFCFGRENIIPVMFNQLLEQMGIDNNKAPLFHYYLSRHVQLDGEVHGPMAIQMIEILCAEDITKWEEVKNAAKVALTARIKLWDFIHNELIKISTTPSLNHIEIHEEKVQDH